LQTTTVKESGTPRLCTRDSRESLDDGRKKCTENSEEAGRERERGERREKETERGDRDRDIEKRRKRKRDRDRGRDREKKPTEYL